MKGSLAFDKKEGDSWPFVVSSFSKSMFLTQVSVFDV